MKYDKIEIEAIKKRPKFEPESLVYRLTQYHSGIKDTTGLGGTWSGSGSLMKVYAVQGMLVGSAAFRDYPVAIFKDLDDLVKR